MLPENYQFVTASPIIPVMVVNQLADAVPMAEALLSGGLNTLEITLRTDCALDAIRAIATAFPDAAVGAGTVCTEAQFKAAVSAGARFVVSPGCSAALVDASRETETPMLPGAVTATEVMAVMAAEFPVIKFFPASTSGGPAAIKAFGGPFADARFVPTGGVTPDNLGEYLGLANVLAVGGSWMIPADACAAGDWDTVARLSLEATQLAKSMTRA